MGTSWYYVQDYERVGPVSEEELGTLFGQGSLNGESYVWRKGLGDWTIAAELEELNSLLNHDTPASPSDDLPPVFNEEKPAFSWDNIDPEKAIFTIKVGVDRGGSDAEYGPYSLNFLKRLFEEKRVNGKTLVFTSGMDSWTFLADIPIFESVFSSLPPVIEEEERRNHQRRPFVARMFFHDNETMCEGVCRDISIGGLQILVASPPCEVGDIISMNVHPDNTDYSFVASGKVVRILEGGQGFSLRFSDMTDEAQKAIETYIEQHQ